MEISFLTLVLASAVFVPVVKSEVSCGSYETCKDCISSQYQLCGWCEKPTPGKSKCLGKNELSQCDPGDLRNPKSKAWYDEKEYLTTDPDIRITPKDNFVELRAGDTVTVQLKVEIVDNPPVDLYYLTDISQSMDDDMKSVSKVATELGEALKNFTTKLRIGFGTFIDKKRLPFYTTYNSLHFTDSKQCSGAYGFCNAMALTTYDAARFQMVVNETKVMPNQDSPEGGLDALLQVLLCTQIAWQKDARKIVLLTTDSPFHYAGDGKLAGISIPNDGQCHYDDDTSSYSKSLTTDYPSVSQIVDAAEKEKIAVVFAVIGRMLPLYAKLSSLGSRFNVTVIEADSSNIINVITEQVEALTKTFKVEANSLVDVLDVSFTNDCPGKNSKNDTCEGLNIGDTANITVSIKLKECPSNGDSRATFQIGISELENFVNFTVDYLCDCKCKADGASREECSNAGSFTCGQCDCDDGRYGNDCGCSLDNQQSDEQCKVDGVGSVCADKGECICGQCHCDNFIEDGEQHKYCSNSLCALSDFSCGPTRDNLCNKNGDCKCGECACNPLFTGAECGCAQATDKCESDVNGTLCSGHGDCECNECECSDRDGEFWYFGEHCEKCRTCGDMCSGESSLMPCVKYQWRENITDFLVEDGNAEYYKKSCKILFIEYRILSYDEIALDMSHLSECKAKDDKEKCEKIFWYDQPTAEPKYIVYYTPDAASCQKDRQKLIVGGIIMSVIVLVVLLAATALLTCRWWMNRRDVEAFKKELKDTKHSVGTNPAYNSPLQENTNPLFISSAKPDQQTSSL